jgi:beta-lactamase regulating signal transducer with metallopeptidase domain
MHAIQILLTRPEVERLGWVLLHFVWQGVLIAVLCALALATFRRASANRRYLIACGALLAMAACLPATWFVVASQTSGATGKPTRLGAGAPLPVSPQPETSLAPGLGHASAASQSAMRLPSYSSSPFARREPVERTGEGQPAVRREPVERSNGGEGASGATWLDRIATALPWLVTAWLIGVFGLSTRLAIGWHGVHRLRQRASLPADGTWQAVLSRLCDRLHIRSSAKLLESSLVDVPTMIGWLRPVILWPPALLAGLSIEQFEALLAHELAHVRRHDYLVNLIQTAIETLLFYHPAVWWLSRRIRHERECCCDDLAVSACGNHLTYARALATLEELRPPARQLALAADGGNLLDRIRRILGVPVPRTRGNRHWLLGLTFSAMLLAIGVGIVIANLATGDEPASQPTNSPRGTTSHPAQADVATQRETGSAATKKPMEYARFELIVQNTDNLNGDLPEELGDRVAKLAHVKTVAAGLMDAISFDERSLLAVIINGWRVDSPLIHDLKILSGRTLNADDHHQAIVGKNLAAKLNKKVGDTIKIYDTQVEIIGIFESNNVFENGSIVTLLSELQDFMNRPRRVTGFLISTDIPRDDTLEHKAQLTEVRKQVQELDKEIAVLPANPERLTEETITVDPGLAAELRALDAMRAGLSTNFAKVDELGAKLLDRFTKPEEQGQIYYELLHVHGQSGLQTPERILDYAQKALKFPLGSRQELMVYIYWGDMLNVRKTDEPWPKQRSEAAAVYLRGLKRVRQYHAPESPPELPDPPPLYDGPDGPELQARRAAMEHYMALKNEADFIKELIYDRKIFIRQIADMYHRRPATAAEIDALRRQAQETLGDDAAVARLMAAVQAPDEKRAPPEPAADRADDAHDKTDQAWAKLGLRLTPIPAAKFKELKNKFDRLDSYRGALRVDEVRPGSAAAMEHLQPGDLLVGLHIWETVDNEQVNWVLGRPNFAESLPLKFYIFRNGETRSGRFDLSIEDVWSKPASGLQARLAFEREKEMNGTPIVETYLELKNVSDSATPIEIPLDPSKIEFKVTDAGGKEIAQAGLPYDGVAAAPGTLRLPHRSLLRLSVAGNGAGVPKDQGGLLDVASSANWVFKRGDVGQYYLRAKIAIPKTDEQRWSGTIEIPDTRIPLPSDRPVPR